MIRPSNALKFYDWIQALLAATAVLIAIAVWVLAPVPFVRGVIVGVFAIAVAQLTVFKLMVRLSRKRARPLESPLLPGEAWDFDMHLTDSRGLAFDATVFKGQVTVMHFCRPWGLREVTEIASLNRLQHRTQSAGVQFACIALGDAEEARKAVVLSAPDMPVYGQDRRALHAQPRHRLLSTIILDKYGTVALATEWPVAWDGDAVANFVLKLATASQ